MISLYINGVAYNYPEPDEPPGWGDEATAWAVAVTQNLIPKNGGLFNLFGDVNFGPSNGLISNYFKSASTDSLGSVGVVRLAYDDVMSFRNAADDGDILIGVNVDGNLTVNGSPVGLPNPGPAGTYLYSNGSLVSWKAIDFSELAGNIAVSQLDGGLGATSSTFFAGDGNWKAVGFDMLSGNIAVSQINSGTGASASTYLSGDGTWKSFPGSNTQVLFRGGANGVTTDAGFTFAGSVLTVGNMVVDGAAGILRSSSGTLQLRSPSSQQIAIRAGVTNSAGPFPSSLNGQVLIEGNDVQVWSNTSMNIDAGTSMRLGATAIDINASEIELQGDFGDKTITVGTGGIGMVFDGKPLFIDGSTGTSGQVLKSTGPTTAPVWADESGGGLAPGSNQQVMFNDGGSFGGDVDFVYDKTFNLLTVPSVRFSYLLTDEALRINGAPGSSGNVLKSNGSSTPPVWGAVQLSETTGTLPINRGGTGQTTASQALTALLPVQTGNSGRALVTNGTSSSWGQVNLAAGVTGVLPIVNGGTGTSSASDAINALLPSQAGNAGRVLSTNGTSASWTVIPAEGSTGSIQYKSATGGFAGVTQFTFAPTTGLSIGTTSGSTANITAQVGTNLSLEGGGRTSTSSPAGNLFLLGGSVTGSGTGAAGSVIIRGGSKVGTSPAGGGDITFQIAPNGTYVNALSIDGDTGSWAVGASQLTGTAGQVLTSNGSGAAPSWQTPSSGLSAPNYEEQVATAAQTVFNTTVNTVAAGSGSIYLIVYVNGVKQREGATKAFTVTGANQITFNAGLAAGDEVEFVSFA